MLSSVRHVVRLTGHSLLQSENRQKQEQSRVLEVSGFKFLLS